MRISDWSSDVCSSDLPCPPSGDAITKALEAVVEEPVAAPALSHPLREEHRQRREIVLTLNDVDYEKFLRCKKAGTFLIVILRPVRSEERRVGKDCVSTCRSGGAPDH